MDGVFFVCFWPMIVLIALGTIAYAVYNIFREELYEKVLADVSGQLVNEQERESARRLAAIDEEKRKFQEYLKALDKKWEHAHEQTT